MTPSTPPDPSAGEPSKPTVILPRVQRVLLSSDATFIVKDGDWSIRSPWAVRFLPAGKKFVDVTPDGRKVVYHEAEMWVYIQVVGGLGRMRLGVECRYVQREFREQPGVPDFPGEHRLVGVKVDAQPFVFLPNTHRLTVHETVIRLSRVPFREEGVYEFRVFAQTENGREVLPGRVAEVTILDPAGRL